MCRFLLRVILRKLATPTLHTFFSILPYLLFWYRRRPTSPTSPTTLPMYILVFNRVVATVVTAIGNHDEGTGVPVNALSAALILADKADVRRSRVRNRDAATFDIHDRVNYSVTKSLLKINEEKTLIKLKLTVDTHYSSVMDYFEIFMQRMILCRKAAEKLGLQFKLMINEQQLI